MARAIFLAVVFAFSAIPSAYAGILDSFVEDICSTNKGDVERFDWAYQQSAQSREHSRERSQETRENPDIPGFTYPKVRYEEWQTQARSLDCGRGYGSFKGPDLYQKWEDW